MQSSAVAVLALQVNLSSGFSRSYALNAGAVSCQPGIPHLPHPSNLENRHLNAQVHLLSFIAPFQMYPQPQITFVPREGPNPWHTDMKNAAFSPHPLYRGGGSIAQTWTWSSGLPLLAVSCWAGYLTSQDSITSSIR